MPGASYEIRAVDCGCDLGNSANYSGPLPVSTSRWCDVCSPDAVGGTVCAFGPEGIVDFANDLLGVLDKFENKPTGLPKARSDLSSTDSTINTVDQIVDVVDYLHVVDAFKGTTFPFAGPVACP